MTRNAADVVIIGAGAYGLSCAWWMARRRTGARVLVIDEGEFASGASGRNGAGFRMQWGMEFNIRLCQESISFFETATEQLDYPRGIELKQDGYLVVAHSQKAFTTLGDCLARQHELGVPSELLDADDCIRMVPALSRKRLAGGSFCGKDGSASPFRWLDALLKACRREGVEIRYGTRIGKIEETNGGFRLHTANGRIEANKVVLCTDWAVPQLLRPLGIDLPVNSLPKEGLVTAPHAPIVSPTIVSLEHHISVNQLPRGSIVFIVARHREGTDIGSTPDFLAYASPKIVDLLPGVAHIPVLRTWGGVSSLTPDMQPILGETSVEGIFVAVSSFRGFMTSPAVGRIMAALVLSGDTNDPILRQLSPERFRTGDLITEPLLNQE
jgi:sarcosine oxidase, subunit beta